MAYFIFHVNVPHQKRVAVINIKLFSNILNNFFVILTHIKLNFEMLNKC